MKGMVLSSFNYYYSSLFLTAIVILIPFNGKTNTIYRSIDGEGNTHFDHFPPKQGHYEALIKKDNLSYKEKKKIEKTSHQTDKLIKDSKYKDTLEKLEISRKKSCHKAQENRKTLLSSLHVKIKLPGGEERTITQSERLEKLKIMDEAIKNLCSPQQKNQ